MTTPYQEFLPWVFPRLLGVVYLIAFGSLLVQVLGLFGANGILPISVYLTEYKQAFGRKAYRLCPTVFWLNSSDRALVGACVAGVLLSIALMVGVTPVPLLLLLWLLYLSYVSVGQEFLSYQWDTLLLEVGFMTIFLPLADPAPPLAVLAYRFLLFRFMFSSGAVKLLSGDPTWRGLTAMTYHYQTQPLPNRIAWYAHNLPLWFQKLSTLATLVLELIVPFLALTPNPPRLWGFALLFAFQLLILATGSYGFFNILTLVMLVPLLDDQFIGRYIDPPSGILDPTREMTVNIIFGIFLGLNICQLVALFYRPHWLRRMFFHLSPWMISNNYGLFAVMTTDRLEFEIEGSDDVEHWRGYDFHFKPGEPNRAPAQAAPHQPRLDWQMWFAALSPRKIEGWMGNMIVRLLEGSPTVLGLFRNNPFPEQPPKYLRLVVWRYRFTTSQERKETGNWWDRTLVARYRPITFKEENEEER
ncbi:lipase maturation factor family protein [Geomesophilobacter sediminis]|uniref:Lipase maturation factor family protein n=1 Tax=Geomesophilobacter sediminis TaxID=2798584 RepID=A0A8J7LW22_9BACT|nr:lipase maturation factor family protein [Geomesophilobacter sediminis]MBJ6726239.1 lipase maturation factor family protein [Geomesophilobacter sediminis]